MVALINHLLTHLLTYYHKAEFGYYLTTDKW